MNETQHHSVNTFHSYTSTSSSRLNLNKPRDNRFD